MALIAKKDLLLYIQSIETPDDRILYNRQQRQPGWPDIRSTLQQLRRDRVDPRLVRRYARVETRLRSTRASSPVRPVNPSHAARYAAPVPGAAAKRQRMDTTAPDKQLAAATTVGPTAAAMGTAAIRATMPPDLPCMGNRGHTAVLHTFRCRGYHLRL